MRPTDLIRSAVGGLWRQKVRTALTLTGVAVGASSLAFSLSLGVGLREMIDREFKSRPGFWEIDVHPGRAGRTPADLAGVTIEGDLSADRAARLRRQIAERRAMFDAPGDPAPITPAAVARMAALPDVVEVVTHRNAYGWIARGDRSVDGQIVAGRCDVPALRERLIAGRLPTDADVPEAAVSELVLYDLGVRDEAAFAAALGSPLAVEFGADAKGGRQRSLLTTLGGGGAGTDPAPKELAAVGKLLADLPRLIDLSNLSPAEKADVKGLLAGNKKPPSPGRLWPRSVPGTFIVVGILRAADDDDDPRLIWMHRYGAVFVSGPAADPLFRRLPGGEDGHYDRVQVRVRPGGDLPAVVKAVEGEGFTAFSAVKWFAAAKREVTAIAAGLNVFALISLVVAGLGITNTLVTSVVERTREIGILKALGARDRAVMGLFLLEGALIGLCGGLLGLGLARAAAVPADGLVKRLVEEQSNGQKLLTETVFEFPPWLSAATVAFAVGVTTLAALYPARRAARVHPVEALRHE